MLRLAKSEGRQHPEEAGYDAWHARSDSAVVSIAGKSGGKAQKPIENKPRAAPWSCTVRRVCQGGAIAASARQQAGPFANPAWPLCTPPRCPTLRGDGGFASRSCLKAADFYIGLVAVLQAHIRQR